MDNYRQLQRTCEQQAALAASPEARLALKEMAEEYRQMADCQERQHPKTTTEPGGSS
ncbi:MULTISPECIES: hypothetical protein [Bradyrhizobium]|uniref:hypothetical protein n=1 Tax=Bradyrhizobium TaxID=374 RepID=UPI0013748043|nr:MULTISPECIES: hypothetical protein [Bradyrhizobium]MBR1169640.1 hypothetical protein [Bradyrhizobium liaoningense]